MGIVKKSQFGGSFTKSDVKIQTIADSELTLRKVVYNRVESHSERLINKVNCISEQYINLFFPWQDFKLI